MSALETLVTTVPPWLVLTLAAALVVVLPRALGHAAGALATGFVFLQAYLAPDGTHLATEFLGFSVVLLNVDQFSAMMGLVVGFLATAAMLYAYSSEAPSWMTAFALLYVASTVGTIYAGDWLTVIFFWELMAVTSTLLVWQYGGEAVRAGYRYAIFHGVGGTVLLGAVVVHFATVESFLFSATTGIHASAALLAAIGIGVNCGFVFLHTWIPDTYPRPHIAASVFLSVFTTKTAVYVMYRAFPEGGWWLAYLGGFMAVYGVFFALLQYDPRRLLSYHIQAQVGYMLAGIGLATLGGAWGEFAVAGGFAHLFNNVLYKSLLFMACGVVIYRTGSNYIKEMGGLWKVMPVAFLVYVIGAASITAMPGFNGYVSKGMVLDATEQVNNVPLLFGYDLLWWLLMVGAVGTFMSFIKLGYYIFFHGEPSRGHRGLADAKPLQMVGMGLTAVACVALGVLWTTQLDVLPFTETTMELANPYSWYADPLQFGHVEKALVLMTAGFVGFFSLKRPLGWLAHHVRDVDALLNPAAFYAGRGAVWGVTELWAAVDRFTMELAGLTMWSAMHPREALANVGVDVEIRTGIGRSVLFVTLIAAAALFALLLG
ncbi:Na(+)/H(+) antiporter subunit D [Halorubrum sp. JWXQ-INN 858]|uniref:Na(+)/H(+) antiporter subunit D n=1 Tax=Halorubrum sp. JWXQ-INN 858 TaxID=2690782 RepID=UPI00135C2B0D|nr:Na(+)/H(+) antiporter subunit D [Halorubrum sp. JWXQ-INN 858]MWV64459.1 Na(+)/H(+) antiporter subunit D [Halorubrum sp. JWXQ-INN 858]